MTPSDGIEKYCLDTLRDRGATLATAESLTGGLVSASLAAVPGASDVLRGGLVAYATDIKTSLLGVDEETVHTFGVVSAQCAEAMASRAREMFGASWALSTTGVAGPDPQEGKPVGTVFVAVAGPAGVRVNALTLSGSRDAIRRATVQEVLALLAGQATQSAHDDPAARQGSLDAGDVSGSPASPVEGATP
jgi:nicotinamide-nucleotide amidase